MNGRWRGSLGSFMVLAVALMLAHSAGAATGLSTINLQSGGTIVFGAVEGASEPAAAMLQILRNLHQSCGERPQIGRAFQMRGADAAGLLFTVTNHAAGNVRVAGLILASTRVPGQAALLSDRADRFNSSINPMLVQLFKAWHPGNLVSAYNPAPPQRNVASPSNPPQQAAQHSSAPDKSAAALPLHTVTAPDNSFQIGLPEGWSLMPGVGQGVAAAAGPQGEQFGIGMLKMAVDPYVAYQATHLRPAAAIPGVMYAPYRGNLLQEFPTLFQAWRRANGRGPVKLTVDSIVPGQPAGPQTSCVQFITHMDANDGKEPVHFSGVMCASVPTTTSMGDYTVQLSSFMIPQSLADREETTVAAIVSSYRPNQQVIHGQLETAQQEYNANYSNLVNGMQAMTAIRNKGVMDRAQIMHNSQEETNAIRQQGIANQQDSFARSNQGQDNYIRDRTVIRATEEPNLHATVSNGFAWTLEQSFPNQVEEVPQSQYIKGKDYY